MGPAAAGDKQIRSALVLPSLIEQWQGEMRQKFSIDLTSQDTPAFRERGAAVWNEFDDSRAAQE